MLHDDMQAGVASARDTREHPIDRLLHTHDDRHRPARQAQSNNYRTETTRMIQRQRVIRSFLTKPDETEVRSLASRV